MSTKKRCRAKRWCFTLNNYTQEEEEKLKTLECEWIIFGHEHLEDGTPHLQGAFTFEKIKDQTTIKKIFPRMHLEVMKGRPEQSKEYCTKEDKTNYFESGIMPNGSGDEGGKATKRKWQEAIQLAENENFDELKEKYPNWYIQHLNKFKQIAAEAKKDKSMEDVTDTEIKKHFLWICGPSGTGKSHTARRIAKEIGCEQPYLKDLNKWWNGYAHQKVTIIEEASPKACEYLASFFKKWCDKWSFTAECKGTVIPECRPEYIIVTSNYSIETCFPEREDFEPLHRRFTEVTLSDRQQHIYWPLNQAEFEEEMARNNALGGNTIRLERNSIGVPESNQSPPASQDTDIASITDVDSASLSVLD